jgi:hypothetical protein
VSSGDAPLSKEDLARALGRRVTRPCPICHGAVWDVPSDITTILLTQHSPNGSVKVTNEEEGHFVFEGIVAVPMVCRECGFIAQFHYDALAKDAQQL